MQPWLSWNLVYASASWYWGWRHVSPCPTMCFGHNHSPMTLSSSPSHWPYSFFQLVPFPRSCLFLNDPVSLVKFSYRSMGNLPVATCWRLPLPQQPRAAYRSSWRSGTQVPFLFHDRTLPGQIWGRSVQVFMSSWPEYSVPQDCPVLWLLDSFYVLFCDVPWDLLGWWRCPPIHYDWAVRSFILSIPWLVFTVTTARREKSF